MEVYVVSLVNLMSYDRKGGGEKTRGGRRGEERGEKGRCSIDSVRVPAMEKFGRSFVQLC